MWSCEGPPTLVESYRRFQEEIDILKDIKQQCEKKNLELLSFYCSRLILVISLHIRDIHHIKMWHKQ